ncbi:MAG: hypothetical protein IPJ41_06390 [Phycisphaerales bacterium]|nr:hypothetical protein [Phycisphaerales bacterium]
MLVQGAIDDPALENPQANKLDRAEALALRGRLDEALALLAGEGSLRAIRIRAEALERLGRFDEADAALDPLVAHMAAKEITSGDDLAEGVRALMVRSRLRGPGRAGEADADFRTLMEMLGRAKNELDRLSWYARLVEAEVLIEKDNPADGQAALTEVLALNPRCSRAWRLLGDLAVSGFDFDQAENIALRLEELAPGSPDAAVIRARGAIRRKDPALADSILDAALARFPQHRELLAEQAASAAVRFDESRTSALLTAFDALNAGERPPTQDDHGSPEAILAVGAALSEARQYAPAAALLERAAMRQPMLSTPWIELGLLEMQAGRDIRAKDALSKALALDPFNVRAANSLKLVDELNSFDEIESDHFVVRYKPGIDEVLARQMPAVLEQIYHDVCGPSMFDHEPEGKTTIELMPDHAAFAVRISGMPQIHTMAAATGPVIAMETPRDGPGHRAGPYDWARTVRHEFIHTVTLSRTHNRIPHWFTEAAAVWGEGGPRPPDWWGLLTQAYLNDTLFDMDTISLRFVRPIKPNDRTQAYAQGNWMYEYMVGRFGLRAPLDLMDLYAQGKSEREAMQQVLKLTPEQFFDDFKGWAKGDLLRAGMLPPEGEPPIDQLIDDPHTLSSAMLDDLLVEHPNHPDLLQIAVQIALKETGGNPTPAMIPLIERFVAARPVDPMPRRLLARLALAGAMDDAPQKVIENLEFLDERELRSPAFALALAERYALAGDLDHAWAKATRATLIAPFDASTREQAGRIALLRGDLDAAESQLVALTLIEPDRDLHKRRLEALRAKRAETRANGAG